MLCNQFVVCGKYAANAVVAELSNQGQQIGWLHCSQKMLFIQQ